MGSTNTHFMLNTSQRFATESQYKRHHCQILILFCRDGGSVQEKELKEKLVSQSAIEDLQQKIQVAEAKLKELDEHKADHENTKKNLKRGYNN